MKPFWFLLTSVVLIGATACVGPRPLKEFTLARTAVDYARYVGAPHLAPGFFYKAEQHYNKGVECLKKNARYEARDHFVKAKKYAEKAENKTRIKKFQSGEPLP